MRTILVVDEPKKIKKADISNHHLEGYNKLELDGIIKSLRKFSEVEVYTNLESFTKNINKFKDCVVFPMYWGETSRFTKGHIASICEANKIDYVGPDPYTSILCNDKYMSKKYLKEFGLKSSNDILLFKEDSIDDIKTKLSMLIYPLVVKPNFGGGSTGICNKNLVSNEFEALEIIRELFQNNYNPLIVEEYLEGYEVSILLLGGKKNMIFNNETQVIVQGKEYFKNSLWAMEDKKINFLESHYKKSNFISKEDKKKAKKLFQSFDKVEYMRIDGRFNSNGFFVIELTPDCYMGPYCDFSISISHDGKTYEDFIKMVFDNHFFNNKGTPQ